MIINSKELRAEARSVLSSNWGVAVLITFLYWVVFWTFQIFYDPETIFFALALLLILVPLEWGFQTAFLRCVRNKSDLKVNHIFKGFEKYGRIFWTLLLRNIMISLWTLLLIVPGIIKSYSYAMTSYVLLDNPELSGNAAIDKSMEIMKGHKWELFKLHLSFIGWGILCIFTLSIGFLWLVPYMQTAQACFYEKVKREYEESQVSE